MPLFLLTCLDKPGALETRLATRPAHLDYVASFGAAVKLAGPVLDTPDGGPIGSHFILDVSDEAAVEAFATQDPYALAGVFASHKIHPFRVVVGHL
ncbi:hypothetical protein PbB2_00246 [Candidatus Phycosocius bacilliformis]|uniref:YCII-related domain-containing protein n=1 Tax=Candidatus Phycosocius bacilliformis TaxID=1445552 RepID=A0A2P2E6C5_9PROT|nr:YciI family protein [Candidatus Phycosocius bacilliformis]GBF56589.1 hypothetical protein PbB2_00246 [Candidatus Phycosocius bacilliformis]